MVLTLGLVHLTILAGWIHADSIPLKPGDSSRSIVVDGRTRTFLVHIPPSHADAKAFPLVLAFHGGGVNAETMIRFSGLNEKADEAGFMVVYPNGTGRLEKILTWNAGNCCGYAMNQKVDDVRFVRELLDDLGKAVQFDPNRVYATGISNGGMMAYRLASELSDRIAAIAPVSGPMGTEGCNPKRPVSVIHFHGTDDDFAPFQGGRGKKSLQSICFFSVEHSMRAWVKANGCPEAPARIDKLDTVEDGMTTTRTTYGPGKEGTEVVLITIEGGGHTWPGRDPRLPLLGKSTKDISANDLMWEFFKKHPKM
ncbi:MAG: hypothetical protein HY360_13610 [Verrucomicrobia bacterium]|nr:hypothetical protein [Verrucomicrobiota bacterium]